MRAPSSARSHRPCSARPIPWPAGTEHLRKRPTTGGWSCRCGLRFRLGLVLACLFLNALQVFKIGAAAGRLFIEEQLLSDLTTGGWSCRCGLRFRLGLVLACLFLNALQVFKIGAAAGRLFIGDEIL